MIWLIEKDYTKFYNRLIPNQKKCLLGNVECLIKMASNMINLFEKQKLDELVDRYYYPLLSTGSIDRILFEKYLSIQIAMSANHNECLRKTKNKYLKIRLSELYGNRNKMKLF